MGRKVKARDIKRDTCIMVHGRAILVGPITEVPEMSSRVFWYEWIGRGERLTVGVDDEIEIADGERQD